MISDLKINIIAHLVRSPRDVWKNKLDTVQSLWTPRLLNCLQRSGLSTGTPAAPKKYPEIKIARQTRKFWVIFTIKPPKNSFLLWFGPLSIKNKFTNFLSSNPIFFSPSQILERDKPGLGGAWLPPPIGVPACRQNRI